MALVSVALETWEDKYGHFNAIRGLILAPTDDGNYCGPFLQTVTFLDAVKLKIIGTD